MKWVQDSQYTLPSPQHWCMRTLHDNNHFLVFSKICFLDRLHRSLPIPAREMVGKLHGLRGAGVRTNNLTRRPLAATLRRIGRRTRSSCQASPATDTWRRRERSSIAKKAHRTCAGKWVFARFASTQSARKFVFKIVRLQNYWGILPVILAILSFRRTGTSYRYFHLKIVGANGF